MISKEEIINILFNNSGYIDNSLGNVIKEERHENIADEILSKLSQHDIKPSLPSDIDAGVEAKHYGDEMNKLGEKPNGFHELDFYNGTLWLRQMIEGHEA